MAPLNVSSASSAVPRRATGDRCAENLRDRALLAERLTVCPDVGHTGRDRAEARELTRVGRGTRRAVSRRHVARAMNALRGRFENFWAVEPTSVVRLVTVDDLIDKIADAATNPVTAGLVAPADGSGYPAPAEPPLPALLADLLSVGALGGIRLPGPGRAAPPGPPRGPTLGRGSWALAATGPGRAAAPGPPRRPTLGQGSWSR